MNKLLCLSSAFLLLFSCSKSDAPTPNPPQKQDTSYYASGWTRVKVANAVLSDITWIDANNLATSSPRLAQIIASNSGGLTWQPLPFYAIGVNLITIPGGSLSWTSIPSGYSSWIGRYKNGVVDSFPVSKYAEDIFYLDNNHGYASLLTSSGIAETHDGGDSWQYPTTGINVGANYSTLFFLDSLHGLAGFGSHVYNTTTGIHSWQQSSFPADLPANTICSKLVLATPEIAYAGFTNGNVYRSVDSGRTFSLLPIQTYNSNSTGGWVDLHFLDVDHGYASYADIILQTSNGGASWDTVVYQKGIRFSELEFFDQNHGAACADDGAVYLYKK